MRITAVLCLLCAVACSSPAPREPSARPSPAPSARPSPPPAVQAEAARLVAAGSSGAVVHVRKGDRTWQAAAGRADAGVPMRTDHRFRIASITKTFTATLVLQQVEEGRLALTDRVDQVLPGVIKTKATVADLLRHTSGISDYLRDERFTKDLGGGAHLRHWPPRELLKYADKEAQGYSNTNFILLGMILEKVSRKPYRELLSERITGPQGLTATELPADDLPKDLAHGIHTDGVDNAELDSSIFWTAGGLISTAADVSSFYHWVFTQDLGRRLQAGGFGIFAQTLGCGRRVYSHSGWIFGYSGMAMSSADGETEVVVQLASGQPSDAIAAAERLMCTA
ncbi:serine hydrolase domain-containing protein [Nonomuraea zeae]|uniref:Beta-lactamase family protein n=1 Tax=Nonomuraea zeae TaxID=1642303 RepID=A0A5S4HJS0_9ACTN|nr:serine hydrolase domain-containing protein [Nonomuraea zeae]TMR39860.1 beta-lactamase family protein [Nonomuraea zeae]